jgi:tRNA(Ile)-lysidine synthase
VSGGADSVALLECLRTVEGALRIGLAVGHVDHGLRAGSRVDAAFVRDLAAAAGLPCHVRTADVRALARAGGRSIEETARTERYRLLGEMAREAGARVVATAHTATDQAETVLLRLLRGTGPLGLAGVDPDRADGVVRPMLCATRGEVRAWAAARGLAFREDPSNLDERFLRNRVRLRLLPMLRDWNPRADHVLAALADDAAALGAGIRAWAGAALDDPQDAGVGVRIGPGGPDARTPYALIEAFRRVTGAPLGLSRTHLDALVRLGRGPAGRRAHLPRDVEAVRTRAGLELAVRPRTPRTRRSR